MTVKFTLEHWLDEGWYVGKIKEIPGVFSQGETLDELKNNIKEAYQLMMEEEESAPSDKSVEHTVIELEL